MKYRKLGRTGFNISDISLGTWQVGGGWGKPFDHNKADQILNTAIDNGINFIDTADVYGGGESEKAIGRIVRSRAEKIYVATKCGRQLNPHTNETYTTASLRKFVEDSLSNMGLEQIDLIQLHCPPTEVYYRPEIFELFERLKEEGKIAKLGISVQKVEEALKGIEFSNVDTVQIIFNLFRQRPAELFFSEAAKKQIGIIVRVPLASGLLSGKFNTKSTFEKDDHRFFNREGAAFDKGETFSGVPFQTGLDAVEQIKGAMPSIPMALLALKWILMFPEVSCIIPGASSADQVLQNVLASEADDLSDLQIQQLQSVYEHEIKPLVHHLW